MKQKIRDSVTKITASDIKRFSADSIENKIKYYARRAENYLVSDSMPASGLSTQEDYDADRTFKNLKLLVNAARSRKLKFRKDSIAYMLSYGGGWMDLDI